jgi:hypothetical protein
VSKVEEVRIAASNAVPFRRVVDHYRRYMIDQRKGYEHERYRIDKIQAFIGADRDVATIDYDLYSALLDQYATMSAQTRRHYATTLLAMLKRAKAERVIKSHQLEGIILPPAPRNGAIRSRGTVTSSRSSRDQPSAHTKLTKRCGMRRWRRRRRIAACARRRSCRSAVTASSAITQ